MPLYTKEEYEDHQKAIMHGAFLMIAIGVVFVNSPGMLLVAIFRDITGFALDVGQSWTFSAISSAACFFLVAYINPQEKLKAYAMLVMSIAIIYAVSVFGFKAEFPLRHLGYFFGSH